MCARSALQWKGVELAYRAAEGRIQRHLAGQDSLHDLAKSSVSLYLVPMTLVLALSVELQDRARLRERFYGAARTVLARL